MKYKILYSEKNKPVSNYNITRKYSFHTDPPLGITLAEPLEVLSFYLQAKHLW